MDVNAELGRALKKLKIPIAMDNYSGNEDKFFVFFITSENPALYADNKPIRGTVNIQLQLSVPYKFDYMQLKDEVCQLLFKAGFSYPEIEVMNDSEVKRIRVIFQIHKTGNIKIESEE